MLNQQNLSRRPQSRVLTRDITCSYHVLSATQRGRQEGYTALIKAVLSASGFTSGCHVQSEEELSACLVEVHREGNLSETKCSCVRISLLFD